MELLKRLIIRVCLILAVFSNATVIADSGSSLGDTRRYEEAILFEIASLDNVYQVRFAEGKHDSVYDRLSPFHQQMIETLSEQRLFILLLQPHEINRIKSYGLTVEPASNYRRAKEQQLNLRLESIKQKASVLENDGFFNLTSPNNISYSIVGDFPALAPRPGVTIEDLPCFETVEETFEQAQQLVDEHPSIAELIDIGDSWEKNNGLGGYDLLVMKITNSQIVEDKPKLFVHSAMHAREWATAPLTLAFATELLEGYGNDADLTWIVDYHEVHILFHMNPDGRKIAEQRVLKRKNNNTSACTVPESSGSEFGIDLNRNFGFLWSKSALRFDPDDNDSNSDYQTSNSMCYATYRGSLPSSEPETQAVEDYVRSLFPDNRGSEDTAVAPLDTQGIHIDVHAHGQDIFYGWSHTDEPAPNEIQLATLSRKLAFFNRYNPAPTEDLYFLDGNSESVSYGELGVPHVTFEIGTSFFYDNCDRYEEKIKPDNIQALVYAAKAVRAPYQIPYGADVYDIETVGSHLSRVDIDEIVPLALMASDSRYHHYNRRVETEVIVEGESEIELTYETINEPFETVAAARYSIDEPPWVAGATLYPLDVEDGAFDESTERIVGSLNPYGLSTGAHKLFFQAQDSNGQWGAVTAQHFEVNDPLRISFAVFCPTNECTFTNRSEHKDGTIVDYQWSFGDGDTAEGEKVVHIYSEFKTYDLSLTVTDDKGRVKTLATTVTAAFLFEVPIAEFTVSCVAMRCSFDGSASFDPDGEIIDYEWRFEGGSVEKGITAEHEFTAEGNYVVDLVVTDWTDNKAISSQPVQIGINASAAGISEGDTSSGNGGGGSMSLLWIAFLILGLRKRSYKFIDEQRLYFSPRKLLGY